jgi:hypothetical protein
MNKKLTFAFLIAFGVTSCGFAQEAATVEKKAAPEIKREKAEASWPEGKITIEYGAPAWKEEFKKQMEGMKEAWRLGKDKPTTATIAFGLQTEQGNLPPGTYTLALMPNGKAYDLMFYEAQTFYDPAFKTWKVKADGDAMVSKMNVDKLEIALGDDKKMSVRFGDMAASWTLKPIKANKPIETQFANVDAKFDVLALPLAGATFKETTIGAASGVQDDVTVRYHMKLTVDGDKATLNFVNERAATIAKEKEMIDGIVKRVSEHLEKNPDPALEGRVGFIKQWAESLEATAKRYDRLKPMSAIETTIVKRDAPATELGVTHDRPTGGITLKLALANGDASFEIKPRGQFGKPREKKAE